MKIETIHGSFAVCKLRGPLNVDLSQQFIFLSRTDKELSLVCESDLVPEDAVAEKGWRLLRVAGELDLSLVGILAGITSALAEAKVPVFSVSTYDTDYFLVKEADYARALAALKNVCSEII